MTDRYEKILAGLDPKTLARFKSASEITIERIPTGSLGLNIALQGGLPRGRLTFMWGNRSAGKSTNCLEIIAAAQREGGVAAYIDAERTFDPVWARRFGVDTDKLIYSRSGTISKATQDVIALQRAQVDVIVVDSITALTPSVYFNEKGEYKDVADSKQIGAQAREFSIAVPEWTESNDNSVTIAISQARNKFGAMHASFIPSGGEAFPFYSSVMVKLWSSAAESQGITGQVFNGDLIFDETIGRKVNWMVEKNKTGPQFRSGEYNFYFDGPRVGIDKVAETLEYSVAHGLIAKSGTSWYEIEGNKLQTKNAVQFLVDNPGLVADLEKTIIYGAG